MLPKHSQDKILITLIMALSIMVPNPAMHAQKQTPMPEEIEWTWEVRPAHPNPKLVNVLLVGDSITRNYYPEVTRQLADIANVYLFASSACIGDPRLVAQLADFATMESVPFRVVHFNNGMHGWTYPEEQYKEGFPAYVDKIRSIAPGASLVWATTTPVKADASPGPTNARIEVRNRIAQDFVQAAGIVVDDEHELMLHHPERYQDTVHFDEQGAVLQGRQVAKYIRDLVPEPRQ
jgi:GDSL-like Lipase/Acylhydrolase family